MSTRGAGISVVVLFSVWSGLPGQPGAGGSGGRARYGRLAGLRNEHMLANRPDGPALRGQSRPQLNGAVPAEVEFAGLGCAVGGPDSWPAPVTCLVHAAPLAGMR